MTKFSNFALRKNSKKALAALVFCILFVSIFYPHPVFADSNNIVETTFFGNVKDDGSGCGVYTVLNLVIDILSIGVGILGVIGITVVGTQYLTAGGNEEKTRKAKHRMFEIVIGLVAYVLLYAGVQFLLPGGHFTNNPNCTTISNEELAKIKEEQAKKKAEEQAKKNTTSPSNKTNFDARKKIADTGVALAWSSTDKPYKSKATPAFTKAMKSVGTDKGESGCRKTGKACGMFVGTVVRYSGVDTKMPTMASRIYDYVRGVGKYKKSGGNKKWKEISYKNVQPGDIALTVKNGTGKHVAMYVKNSKGETVIAEGSLCDYYGVIKSRKRPLTKVYRYVGDS